MGYKLNPFTGNLDATDSPNGVFEAVEVNGDITLDDGGTYATTLQLITPTANRTISFPDATGTVGLVAGSSGQLVYNNAGVYAGASSTSVGATGNITLSLAGAASTPPVSLTGTWFSGGTSTTTKPQLLIEPVGTTSTAWSTSGTGLGVNAASGFAGRLLDLQVNGTSTFNVSSAGSVTAASFIPTTSTVPTNGLYLPSANNVAISTNGTGKLFIAGNGFVGLGVTSPAGILHVAGVNPQNVYIENTGDQIASVGALIYRMSGQNVAQIQAERVDAAGRGTHLKFSTAQVNTGTLTERLRIDSSGRVGVGTTSPTALLDVSSDVLRLRTAKTPASATDTGNAGDICWDDNYVYVCTASNTWKRSALSSW